MQNFEQIRPARASDLFRLTEIYNEAIRTGRCTGDTREFSADERLPWFQEHLDPAYPLFVFERDGHVLGYLYLTAYRKGRGALRGTVEVSYYLDFRFHGQGIGSRLLCPRYRLPPAPIGYHTMLAILLSCKKKAPRCCGNLASSSGAICLTWHASVESDIPISTLENSYNIRKKCQVACWTCRPAYFYETIKPPPSSRSPS